MKSEYFTHQVPPLTVSVPPLRHLDSNTCVYYSLHPPPDFKYTTPFHFEAKEIRKYQNKNELQFQRWDWAWNGMGWDGIGLGIFSDGDGTG